MKKLSVLPDLLVANVSMLDEAFYKTHGIKAVIFDIDNTLVAHTEPEPPENVLSYFEFLKSIGIKYSIVSNNSMERVHSFSKNLGIPYYYKALKPRKKYLKKVLSDMGEDARKTALIGDQLFTDVLGGKIFGSKVFLTEPLGPETDFFIKIKRKFEKFIR